MHKRGPDFFIAGFSKCGSTTLHGLLSDHPGIFIADRKDVGYLTQKDLRHDPDLYNLRFLYAPVDAILGEASVNYSGNKSGAIARERILKYYPDIKLIFIARDPIERMESAYREFHHSGELYGIQCPFELSEAIQEFPEILLDSLYWERINNYRPYFSEAQIHLIFLEDLVANPVEELRRCLNFLNVDPDVSIENIDRRLNAGRNKLYDSRQLRNMRNGDLNPGTSLALADLPLDIQDSLFVQLGLRKPFATGPLDWDAQTLRMVMQRLREDSNEFLQHCGKSPQIWPRFSAVCDSFRV